MRITMGMSTRRTIRSEGESGPVLPGVRAACTMDIRYLCDRIQHGATMVPSFGTCLQLGSGQLLPQILGMLLPDKNGAPWAPFSS